MARKIRDTRLDTRQARLRLPVAANREPYWRLLQTGLHLGYRKAARGGMWMVRLQQGGRYIKKVLGQADDHRDSNGVTILSYAEAQKIAHQFVDRDLSPLTVSEAAERYLAWFKDNRKGFRETELNIRAHILPTLGSYLVSELKAVQLRHWLNTLATTPARKRSGLGRPVSFRQAPETEPQRRARKSSANRSLTILKAILNKSFQDELVSDDMAWRRVKPFENVDMPLTRFLTETEATRLVNAARPDFRLLVKAGLLTGARYTELTTLKAKDFNASTKTIFIQPSKSGKARYIPLSPDGFDLFQSLCAGIAGNTVIFRKQDGTGWGRNHHVRLLQEACQNARIAPAISFHDLRHTYASLLAQKGADLLTISKLLGHADTRITSRHYAHLCDKTLADAVNALLPSFGHVLQTKIAVFA